MINGHNNIVDVNPSYSVLNILYKHGNHSFLYDPSLFFFYKSQRMPLATGLTKSLRNASRSSFSKSSSKNFDTIFSLLHGHHYSIM